MIAFFADSATDWIQLNQCFLYLEFLINPDTNYFLKGNIQCDCPSNNAALVTFTYKNKSGNIISPPYFCIPTSEKVGPYKYIPINSSTAHPFQLSFKTHSEAFYIQLGFRTWNNKNLVFIENKIEITVQTSDEIGFEVIDNLPNHESELAKNYWSAIGVSRGYTQDSDWSHRIADEIISFNPFSVLEFGCNVGRNLKTLLQKSNTIEDYLGLDINQDAIKYGNSLGLDKLKLGDEKSLICIPDGSYDICFTVSVIDHIPQPMNVVLNLIRISNKACLFLEPYLGDNGKVLKNYNVQKKMIVETTPYSYSWNYKQLLEAINIYEFLNKLNINVKDFPLNSNLGRYYKLWILEK